MEQVSAPDSRTVLIRWRNPYADAGVLVAAQFQALPEHILGPPLEQLDAEAFASHPFWTSQYVGLGPYRLERWEPGTYIQGVAFDGHALGKPKIQHVVVRFTPDENTGLSNLLAGEVQLVTDRTIRFEQAQVLQQEWARNHGGTVILTPNQPRFLVFQHRSEYADPSLIMDSRVHQAIASGIDKQALNDALFAGEGVMSNTLITPQARFYADVQRVITRYPYDPRRVDELLGEAGLTKNRDGVYITATGERFNPEILAESVGQFQREMTLLMATWRTLGIETQSRGLPSVQIRDGPARAIFPALLTASASPAWQGGAVNLGNWASADIKSATNGWRGSNFAGWSNPDYDRLWAAYNSTLEPSERTRQIIEMARLISVHLPIVDLYWNPNITAHLASLRGPDPRALDTLVNWNVHEWELS
jgi:peptide/nickel transport system substrate-binding protein